MEKYSVKNFHHSNVKCLKWSRNALKLFSADDNGVVNCTEFDYDKVENNILEKKISLFPVLLSKEIMWSCGPNFWFQFTSRSYFVHKEAHAIVQLDYSSRLLLVSSRFRSIVLDLNSDSHIQLGTKDRKMYAHHIIFAFALFSNTHSYQLLSTIHGETLFVHVCSRLGHFGAVFLPGSYNQKERIIFAARPGLRLWIATATGTVNATYMFKDQLKHGHDNILLLPDTASPQQVSAQAEAKQFGRLLLYQVVSITFANTVGAHM